MDIHILAFILMAAHITAIGLMGVVIRKQWKLFKSKIQLDLVWLRRSLFALSVTVTFGNLISVFVDLLTVLDLVTRSTNYINPIGLLYSGANTLVALVSALIIWLLYKLAAKALIVVEHDKEVALKRKGR